MELKKERPHITLLMKKSLKTYATEWLQDVSDQVLQTTYIRSPSLSARNTYVQEFDWLTAKQLCDL